MPYDKVKWSKLYLGLFCDINLKDGYEILYESPHILDYIWDFINGLYVY